MALGAECQEDHQGPSKGHPIPRGERETHLDILGSQIGHPPIPENLAQKYFRIEICKV